MSSCVKLVYLFKIYFIYSRGRVLKFYEIFYLCWKIKKKSVT